MQKRIDHATQDDMHPQYEAHAEAKNPAPVNPTEVMSPVPVQHRGPIEMVQKAAKFGIPTTFVIPPGSAYATLVLPEDPGRLRAVIQVNGAYAVFCATQSAAQAPGNLAASTGTIPPTPAGYLAASGTGFPALENQSALWAVNSDPTKTLYVSVMVERNNP